MGNHLNSVIAGNTMLLPVAVIPGGEGTPLFISVDSVYFKSFLKYYFHYSENCASSDEK